ncbi:MAG: hypothetical protein LBU61_06285, partial [Coriobacteriales bacterium]|nr:hypothetical protein [Coriobacteriales bacterium]
VINVTSNGQTNVLTASGAIAVGGVAVNAGLAVAVNLTTVHTYIGQGVSIDGWQEGNTSYLPNINVTTNFGSEAKSLMLSISGGAVAVSVVVTVVINRIDARTYIGITPKTSSGDKTAILPGSIGFAVGTITANNVTVQSNVSGDVNVLILGVAGGAVSVNAAVALGFNYATGVAAISAARLNANSLTVSAFMDGDTTINTFAVTGGMVAVGATVAVGYIKTTNLALIDTSAGGLTVRNGNITVQAGTAAKPYSSDVVVTVITGAAGAFAGALNFAIAINQSGNYARIIGSNTDVVIDAANLLVEAHGNAHAYAVIGNAAFGVAAVSASVAYSDILSIQEALINSYAEITLSGNLEVISRQNLDPIASGSLILDYMKNDSNKAGTTNKYVPVGTMSTAYIFAASVGLVTGVVNVAIASANATSIAYVRAANINAQGSITVTNTAASKALANIDNLGFGLVSVGLMVGYAYADGDFQAILSSIGSITAGGNIAVTNNYTAIADMILNPAFGGVKISAVSLDVNVALARVATRSEAAINGSGRVQANNISVVNFGLVRATSEIKGGLLQISIFSLTSNNVVALLSARQDAYISGAHLVANDVSVLSLYNVNESADNIRYNSEGLPAIPSVNWSYGAFATVGASVANIGLAVAKVNAAYARSESQVSAYITGASSEIAGRLDVHTYAASNARTDINQPSFSVSLVNIGVSVLYSNAEGVYRAYIDSTGNASLGLKAGSIRVGVGHYTEAYSRTGPLGGMSVSLSGVNVNVNTANANARATAEAFIRGNGVIATTGDLIVQVNGSALANATIQTETVALSLVDVRANVTYANLNVVQNAYFNIGNGGLVDVGGSLNIRANYSDDSYHGAIATSGTTNGVSLTLVSATATMAFATSALQNTAYISGSGQVTVTHNVLVLANSQTWATATVNRPTTITLAELSMVYAESRTFDVVTAYIRGVTLIAGGNIDVKAVGRTTSYSSSAAGLSLSLVNFGVGNVKATIGADNRRFTVEAYIYDYTKVTAAGNINVEADSAGRVTSRLTSLPKDWQISAVANTESQVQTVSYYLTKAWIGSYAEIKSTGGNITVYAHDLANADALVDGNSIGVLFSGDHKYARNTVYQTTIADIWTGADLWAHGSVDIKTKSDARMDAITHAQSGGFIAGGALQAFNTVYREAQTNIYNYVQIFADFGNISITSHAGEDDRINTIAKSSIGTGFGGGESYAVLSYSSFSVVNIGGGVNITDTFGDVLIAAYVAAAYLNTSSDIGISSVGSSTKAESIQYLTINNTGLTAQVNLATNSNPDLRTYITAKNITVLSKVNNVYIYAYSYSSTSGAMEFAKAYSVVNLLLIVEVNLNNVHLRAYDDLLIMADAVPTNGSVQKAPIPPGTPQFQIPFYEALTICNDPNVLLHAETRIRAATGCIESHAWFQGYASATVNIGGLAKLTGANVMIDRQGFPDAVIIEATGSRGLSAAEKKIDISKTFQNYLNMNIDRGVVFEIGDAAAGMAIDIYYDSNGAVRYRSVGTLPGFEITIDPSGHLVLIPAISNNQPGRLTVVGSTRGLAGNKIYGQQYIPELVVTNRTDYGLVFGAINLYNADFRTSQVTALDENRNNSYTSAYQKLSLNTHPEISVYSRDSGSVTFTDLVSNERGNLHIEWTDVDKPSDLFTSTTMTLGSVGIAPIWVHDLTVLNARNVKGVGNPLDEPRFQVYLTVVDFDDDGVIEDAHIWLDAIGDVWLELTLAEITPKTDLSGALSNSPLPGTLDLEHLVTGGHLDILLPLAIRLDYLVNSKAASVYIPGVFSYTEQMIQPIGSAELTLGELSLYLSRKRTEGYSIYYLPNGTQLYLDEQGKIARMVAPNGSALDTSAYRIEERNGQAVVTFWEFGIELNLATGVLTVISEVCGFDVYLDYDPLLGWYTLNGTVNKWQGIQLVRQDTQGNYQAVDQNVQLSYWQTIDGIDYYFLTTDNALKLTTTDPGINYRYYVVAFDADGNLFNVYLGTRSTDTWDLDAELDSEQISYSDNRVLGTGTVVEVRLAHWEFTTSIGGADYVLLLNQQYTIFETYSSGVLVSSNTSYSPYVIESIIYAGSDITANPQLIFGAGSTVLSGYVINAPEINRTPEGRVTGAYLEFNYIALQQWSPTYSLFDPGENNNYGLGYTIPNYDGLGSDLLVYLVVEYRYTDGNGYQNQYQMYDDNGQLITVSEDYLINSGAEEIVYYFSYSGGRIDLNHSFSQGNYIHVSPGSSISLNWYLVNGVANYRITDALTVSSDGVISFVQRNADDRTIRFTYDLVNLDAQLILIHPGFDVISLYYDPVSEKAVISGRQYLVQLTENIAKRTDNEYYFHNGLEWVLAELDTNTVDAVLASLLGIPAATVFSKISYSGETHLLIYQYAGTTYHVIYQNGLPYALVGSDGSVRFFDEDNVEKALKLQLEGTNYLVSYLEGFSVTLQMNDLLGSILDGDTIKGRLPDNLDIHTKGGDLTFIAHSLGSFGRLEDPLEVSIDYPGVFKFFDLSGNKIITTDTYLYIEDGDFELDEDTQISGTDDKTIEVIIATKDGSIYGDDIRVSHGRFILYTNVLWIVEADGVHWDPTPGAQSPGNIFFRHMGTVSSEISFNANALSNNRRGDIRFESIIGRESSVYLVAGAVIGQYSGDEPGILCDEYGYRAFIKFADDQTDAISRLSLAAAVSIGEADDWLIIDIPAAMTLYIPAAGSIYLDALELILAMKSTDPDALTEYDQIAIGNTPLLACRIDLVTHPNNPKVNEFSGHLPEDLDEIVWGDHLDLIEKQMLQMLVDRQNPDELASWILTRVERGEWTALLVKDVIVALLGRTDGIPVDLLAELLSNEQISQFINLDDIMSLLSDEDLLALIAAWYPIDSDAWAEALVDGDNPLLDEAVLTQITSALELANYLSPEQMALIFEGLSEAQKTALGFDDDTLELTIADLVKLVEDDLGLTLTDLLALLLGYDAVDTVPISFLAELVLRYDVESLLEAIEAYKPEAILLAITYDASGIFDLIFGSGGIVNAVDPDLVPDIDSAELPPAVGDYVLPYELANRLLSLLLELQMTPVQRLDAAGQPELDADGKPIWEAGPACFGELGRFLGSLLTADEIESLYYAAMAAGAYPQQAAEDGYDDPLPRAFNVHIGQTTGTTDIYCDGDINIVVERGNLTINTITSERGNVTINHLNGNIVANYVGGVHDGHHILAGDITLIVNGNIASADRPLLLEQRDDKPTIVVNCDESMYFDPDYVDKIIAGDQPYNFEPGLIHKEYILRYIQLTGENGELLFDAAGCPLMAWVLDVEIRYDWVRLDYYDPEPRMALTVRAHGDVFLAELTGSVRGSIWADGDVVYTVADGEVGRIDDPLETNVRGTITINARDDISVYDLHSIVIIANSLTGQVNVVAERNIDLRNSNGQDLIVGPIYAKTGDVLIVSQGSIVEGNRYEGELYGAYAQVTGTNITLYADGSIGVVGDPFDIDTRSELGGMLTAYAFDMVINEISNDLIVWHVESLFGDTTLIAAARLLDGTGVGGVLQDALEA